MAAEETGRLELTLEDLDLLEEILDHPRLQNAGTLQRLWDYYASAHWERVGSLFEPDIYPWWNWPQPPRFVPMLLKPGSEYEVLSPMTIACHGCHRMG